MALPAADWKEELLAYHESIYLICLGFTRNPTVAEDLCQDVYLKAWGKLHTVRNGGALKSWIIRIARNVCLDFVRKTPPLRLSARERHQIDFQLWSESAPINPDDDLDKKIALVNAAVDLLPRKLREALVLREYGNLSYEEMAKALRIKAGTVMSRLHRARRTVVTMFEERNHDAKRH
jgi:RNA polymerase sigma-70 factor (ECF subfamily)